MFFAPHKPPEGEDEDVANHLGLTVLYDPGECATLDIVAVHGLTGNVLGTWTHSGTQKLWLRDFLPDDIKGARILTFGYDTSSFTTALKGRSFVIAEQLLTLLLDKRDDVSGQQYYATCH